ncbi:hypothetical protein PRIPAC_87971 [Pristionchus pacificus]|uniref:glucuronosyltransferase n=1 Tax=Pristionchus pacificus TaxID=54126 RepID=A0A2A6CW18_PRIPA|nr:hypothetical protein PRIPAC_87971 [Pristionchus pacificus]|eukprot:PDM82328.1 Glycosyltransferase [Pristionchus pacificus]
MRLPIVLVLLLCINAAQSYKILVYCPRFMQSINNFLGNIADILVEEGHDVTTIIPIVNPYLKDGTHLSKKIYVQPTEAVAKITARMNFEEASFFEYDDFDLINSAPIGRAFMGWVNAQCPGVLDEPRLIERLKEEKFDVMIVENWETCGVGLSHLIKPKSLITASGSVPMGQQGWEFGLDSALSYNPNPLVSSVDIHSMWSRAWNMYAQFVFLATYYSTRNEINTLFQERYGPEFPSITEISSHAAYTFINSEPLIDFAAPTLSRVISIGGIGAKEPKKLDKDLDDFLSLRKKTVLISFGSIVQSYTLPLEVKQNILKMITRFPEVTFLWKYEKPHDDFAKKAAASTPNLHLLKWTPQNDLLADERLTAFITHGGMASTQETALRGKPGFFIPFLADQPRNSGMMEKNGLGRVFDKRDLYDADKFHAAVKDLIENESNRKNMAKIAAMIAKKPFSARDMLVKTVDFAAEFGPSPALRPQSFDMNWIEYYNVDIILLFVIFSGVAVLFMGRVVSSVKGTHVFLMCLTCDTLSTLLCLSTVQSYKILVYSPRFSQSINNFLGNIADTLVESGHDVLGNAYSTWVASHCRGVLDEPGLIEKMKDEKFDVMIVEVFEVCGTGMILSSLDVHSFWGSLTNIYAEFIVHLSWYSTRTQINNLFHARCAIRRSIKEISSHAAYSFVNSETLIEFAAPTLSRVDRDEIMIVFRVIYIGGIGAKTPKKLNNELDRLFALRNKTVLISFGSVVVSQKLPLKVKQTVVEVNSTVFKNSNMNCDFRSSLAFLMLHSCGSSIARNAKSSHAQMDSAKRYSRRSKIDSNAGMMQRSGVGKVFNKLNLFHADKLYAAVKDLLENDSYRQAALRNSGMIQKKPFSAKEILVKTVEFAAEFGPSPALRPQSFHMSWIEYHNVDIIAVSALIMILIISFVVKICIVQNIGWLCLKEPNISKISVLHLNSNEFIDVYPIRAI